MSSGFGGFKNVVVSVTEPRLKTEQGIFCEAEIIDLALGNGNSIDMLFRIGARDVHILPQMSAGGDATLETFEAPTTSADGTPVTVINRNRTRTDITPLALAFDGPTITDPGTLLDTLVLAGGSGGNSQGGDAVFETEWIFAPNTDYLFRLTNIAGQTQIAHLHFNFYEDLNGGVPI